MKRNKHKHHIKHTFFKTLFAFVAALFLISCAKDEDDFVDFPKDDNHISVSSKIKEGTNARIAGNEFEKYDHIGIFVVPFSEDNSEAGEINTSDYAVNKMLIFNGSSWLLPSGGKIPWPTPKRNVDIYGYYPYDEGLGKENATSYLFTVGQDQKTKSNYHNSDLLWTKVTGVAPTADLVNLSFGHKLSKVRVNLKTEVDSLVNKIPDAVMYISNVKSSAILNLADGTLTMPSSNNVIEIGMFQDVVPASGYAKSAEGIIVPQSISAGTAFIRIELPVGNGQATSYILPEDITFESGTERTINITITRSGLSVSTGPIADWQTTETIEGDIGKPIPLVLDLNTIDWGKSLVYNVYDKKGVQVAEVAKEYLFKSNTVDYQAIVIYSVGSNGSIDRSKGFVAKVMNRNRNTTTNEYEPNSSSIHGGTVVWGSNNTMSSYSVGSQALFDKVEISNSGVKSISNKAISTLKATPDVMTDIDGNQYPIVKVSSQYWIAENLKTERYRDGSPINYYYYNDNRANKDIYGALYTWDAIMDSRGIAPENWHVPVNNDFILIYQYLTPDAGRKMKANTLWSNLNNNDNVSGFSGLPGGRRTNTGTYNEINNYGQWWTSTETSTTNAYRLYLSAGDNAMHNETLNKNYTQSLRLIRD